MSLSRRRLGEPANDELHLDRFVCLNQNSQQQWATTYGNVRQRAAGVGSGVVKPFVQKPSGLVELTDDDAAALEEATSRPRRYVNRQD